MLVDDPKYDIPKERNEIKDKDLNRHKDIYNDRFHPFVDNHCPGIWKHNHVTRVYAHAEFVEFGIKAHNGVVASG
jgi:hypothetical protein